MSDYSTVVLPLHPSAAERSLLEGRFSAGAQVYRALVHEGLKRLDRMRESKAWRNARKLPEERRSKAYLDIRASFGMDEFSFRKLGMKVRGEAPHLKEHLGSTEAGLLGERVWQSLSRHLFADASGRKAGRPKVPRLEDLTALGGDTRQGIALKGSYAAGPHKKDSPVLLEARGRQAKREVPLYLQWNVANGTDKRLVLKVRASFDGEQAKRHEHYLGDKAAIHSSAVVRAWVRGKWHYCLHVKVAKAPYRPGGRYDEAPDRKVCVDLGPQTLAFVSDTDPGTGHDRVAELYRPTRQEQEKAKTAQGERRRRQRAQERSRRGANPHAYDGKSRVRTERITHISQRYKARRDAMRETARVATAEAKRREDEIAKALVQSGGIHVVTEDVRVSPWAKLWGASVARFAPARFLTTLEREAALAGGDVRRVSTWTSRLSSTCVCGAHAKKDLSTRVHWCTCGALQAPVHRDLFSAFLGLHLEPEADLVDANQAMSAWAGVEGLLALVASTPTSKLVGPTRRVVEAGVASSPAPAPLGAGVTGVASPGEPQPDAYREEVVPARGGPRDGDQCASAGLLGAATVLRE